MIEKSPFFNLLDQSFPGMKVNVSRCESIGYPWASKPFLKEEGNEVLSHVGFLDYPLIINGREYKTGGLNAVCTRTSHRGLGFASELIQQALSWAKEHYECVLLFTEIPQFYETNSFRKIQEYRFHLPCPHAKGSQLLKPLISPNDDVLFFDYFNNRSALSNYIWLKDNGTIASFNAFFTTFPTYWSLYYCSSIDAILSFEIKDRTLHLYDVIASKLPSLESILDHIQSEIDHIYFYFSPDRFTVSAVPEPYLFDNSYLMVHGNWPLVQPFMIPPLARC